MNNYLSLKEEKHSYFESESLEGRLLLAGEELARRAWREKTNNERGYLRKKNTSIFTSGQEEAKTYWAEMELLKGEIGRANQEKDRWQRKVAELEEELRSVERSWQQAEIAYKARAHCLKEECDKLREELEMISAKLAGELKENERLKSSIVHCINESGVFREQSGVQRQVVYAEYNTFEPGAVQINGSVLPSARFAPSVQDEGRKEAAL